MKNCVLSGVVADMLLWLLDMFTILTVYNKEVKDKKK